MKRHLRDYSVLLLVRIIILSINIILSIVFHGDLFVIGYTWGVNLVIILESISQLFVVYYNEKVDKHNIKVILEKIYKEK